MDSELSDFTCNHCKLPKHERTQHFLCNSCKNDAVVCKDCVAGYVLKHRDGNYIRCSKCNQYLILKDIEIERKTLDDFIPPFIREYFWDTFSLGCIGLVGTSYFHRMPSSWMTALAFVGAHLISLVLVFGYHVVDAFKIQSPLTMLFAKEKRTFYHWFIALYTMSYFGALSVSSIASSSWLESLLIIPPICYIAGSVLNYCIPNYFHLHKVVIIPK